jgi:hypothetical protein
MNIHDSHFVDLRADREGIWFDLETDTGERAEACLDWEKFHAAYTSWLVSQSEKNELAELDEELKRTGLG